MSWELYEVWHIDDNAHEELIDTTKSLKEARALAQKTLDDFGGIISICKENTEGDQEEIQRLTLDTNGSIISYVD